MKSNYCSLFIALALFSGFQSSLAQGTVITSLSGNGVLSYSNAPTVYPLTVEWASSPMGPWYSDWTSLVTFMPGTNGTGQVGVPMFYRLLSSTTVGMAPIPAGTFAMGNPALYGGTVGIDYLLSDAYPPVNITVSAFYMDINLVSYGQWLGVYNWATNHGYALDNPGRAYPTNYPVTLVNWYDCVKWCNARSQQAGLPPAYYTDAGLTQVYTNGDVDAVSVNWGVSGYRLPTEAEWERAARGGLPVGYLFPWSNNNNKISYTLANYGFQLDAGELPCYPWDASCSGGNDSGFYADLTSVGRFFPNPYGLYDMAGNASEWCWDWYGTPYAQPTATDPTGPTTGGLRVLRGGNYSKLSEFSMSGCRDKDTPNTTTTYNGFRCARVVGQ